MKLLIFINKKKLTIFWIFLIVLILTRCTAAFDNSRIYSFNIEAKRFYDLGVQYSRENKPDDAIEAYTRSIAISPGAAAYNNRCVEYNRKGLYDAAMADAAKAIYLSPNYAAPYFNRGNAYFKKNDYGAAVRDYTKAINLDPGQAEFYFNCALAYVKTDREVTAINMYFKAVEADPNYYAAYYNLASLYSMKNDRARALEYLEKAVNAGFADANRMKRDPGLANIRHDNKFRFLLLRLEKKGNRTQ